MSRFLKSFLYAFYGLKTAWNEEPNFRIQTILAFIVLGFAFFFHFSYMELVAIVVSIILVTTAEIFNTAIEDLCNRIESNHDPEIKKIKDLIAAGVLAASAGALILGVLTFIHHFFV